MLLGPSGGKAMAGGHVGTLRTKVAASGCDGGAGTGRMRTLGEVPSDETARAYCRKCGREVEVATPGVNLGAATAKQGGKVKGKFPFVCSHCGARGQLRVTAHYVEQQRER
jgi:hypothetical protein